MDKNSIRLKYIKNRNDMNPNDIKLYSKKILEKILLSDSYKKSKSIFTYVSIGNEVETISMINLSLQTGKKVAVPKTFEKGKMKFYFITSFNDLEKSKFNLLEPINLHTEAISNENSVFIVPGVAFDFSKNRIGYGAGYYDRYLNKASYNKIIALAYEQQLVDTIPVDQYDIKMDLIFTETNTYS